MVMASRVSSIFGLLLVLSTGCEERWRSYTPVDVKVADPASTYEATIQVLHARGYQIMEDDARHLFVRVRSHLDNDATGFGVGAVYRVTMRTSCFSFQVQGNGSLTVTADGYHLRDGNRMIDHRLDDERKDLARSIRELATSGRMRPAPTPPAEDSATLQPAG